MKSKDKAKAMDEESKTVEEATVRLGESETAGHTMDGAEGAILETENERNGKKCAKMASVANEATHDETMEDGCKERKKTLPLKQQLFEMTLKCFNVNGDVYVNKETNRFSEPSSGKKRSNVRSINLLS